MADNDNPALAPRRGYARLDQIHKVQVFRTDVLALDPPTAVLYLDLPDGTLQLSLDRQTAERLLNQLHSFLRQTDAMM